MFHTKSLATKLNQLNETKLPRQLESSYLLSSSSWNTEDFSESNSYDVVLGKESQQKSSKEENNIFFRRLSLKLSLLNRCRSVIFPPLFPRRPDYDDDKQQHQQTKTNPKICVAQRLFENSFEMLGVNRKNQDDDKNKRVTRSRLKTLSTMHNNNDDDDEDKKFPRLASYRRWRDRFPKKLRFDICCVCGGKTKTKRKTKNVQKSPVEVSPCCAMLICQKCKHHPKKTRSRCPVCGLSQNIEDGIHWNLYAFLSYFTDLDSSVNDGSRRRTSFTAPPSSLLPTLTDKRRCNFATTSTIANTLLDNVRWDMFSRLFSFHHGHHRRRRRLDHHHKHQHHRNNRTAAVNRDIQTWFKQTTTEGKMLCFFCAKSPKSTTVIHDHNVNNSQKPPKRQKMSDRYDISEDNNNNDRESPTPIVSGTKREVGFFLPDDDDDENAERCVNWVQTCCGVYLCDFCLTICALLNTDFIEKALAKYDVYYYGRLPDVSVLAKCPVCLKVAGNDVESHLMCVGEFAVRSAVYLKTLDLFYSSRGETREKKI